MDTDPLAFLAGLGVITAWASDMEWAVLWLPDERMVVLDAQHPRQRLAEALDEFMPEMLGGCGTWPREDFRDTA